jgi:hypothetical protein
VLFHLNCVTTCPVSCACCSAPLGCVKFAPRPGLAEAEAHRSAGVGDVDKGQKGDGRVAGCAARLRLLLPPSLCLRCCASRLVHPAWAGRGRLQCKGGDRNRPGSSNRGSPHRAAHLADRCLFGDLVQRRTVQLRLLSDRQPGAARLMSQARATRRTSRRKGKEDGGDAAANASAASAAAADGAGQAVPPLTLDSSALQRSVAARTARFPVLCAGVIRCAIGTGDPSAARAFAWHPLAVVCAHAPVARHHHGRLFVRLAASGTGRQQRAGS